MIISRRGIIGGLLAAPAIIKLAPLMRISPVSLPLFTTDQIIGEYQANLTTGLVGDRITMLQAMYFVRKMRPTIQSTFPRELL
jgi:hypothetical protein